MLAEIRAQQFQPVPLRTQQAQVAMYGAPLRLRAALASRDEGTYEPATTARRRGPRSRTPAILSRAQRAHPPPRWAPRSKNASTPSIYRVDGERLCASETRCAAGQSHAARRWPATHPIQRHALMQGAGRVRDVIIVGSGPAGYTAAIYAARAGLDTLVVEGQLPGGALMAAGQMDNYPGFSQPVRGRNLARAMRAQAHRFGAEFHAGTSMDSIWKVRSNRSRSTGTRVMLPR